MNKYQYAFIKDLKLTQYANDSEGVTFLVYSVILPYLNEEFQYEWERIDWIKDEDIDTYNYLLINVSEHIKSEEKKLLHRLITGEIKFPNVEYKFVNNHSIANIITPTGCKYLFNWLAFDIYAIAESMEIFI